MFIGHFAVALGAKKWAPTVSLGVLFLAGQLADLIWPNLVLLGVETVEIQPGATALTPLNFVHYPFSHSLLAMLLWGTIFALLYRVLTRAGTRSAAVVAVVVLSHWLLDVLTHRPDMPLTFADSTRVGLGLWNEPLAAVSTELVLFAVGVWLYIRQTKPRDRTGVVGFWALILFLLAIYGINLIGPPPPSPITVAGAAEAIWLIVIWGFWVDRHREPRNQGSHYPATDGSIKLP